MLAGRDFQGAQQVVDAANLDGLTVDRGLPAGIVDFTKYDQTALIAGHFVAHFIWLALRQTNAAGA